MSKDGVKRWLDNDQPCSSPQCFDCEFVNKEEDWSDESNGQYLAFYCNLALPGGKEISRSDIEEEDFPEWCPLLEANKQEND